MSFSFIAGATAGSSSMDTLTIGKPTGTAQDDILLAVITRHSFTADPISTPSGWTKIGGTHDVDSLDYVTLWWKLAGASEPASYVWEFPYTSETRGSIIAGRGGFDTSDPIENVSDTVYSTTNTTLRAAGINVSKEHSTIIFTGAVYYNASWGGFTEPASPDSFTDDYDPDVSTDDLWHHFSHLTWSGSGATGDIDATLSDHTNSKHAFAVSLNLVINEFTAEGILPLPEFAASFDQVNSFTADGDLPLPEFDASFVQINTFVAAGLLPIPIMEITFEPPREWYFDAYAIYGLDSFSNDTVTPSIWERSDSDMDLTQGDGETAGTYPTFTEDTDPAVAYYAFDGVDDYVSNWPTMPDEYTVIIAKTTSYPDGQPEIQSCTDTTIETALTTPGGFTGNLHGMLIFAEELTATQLAYCEAVMLRRLWRDTFVDPFTARLIRDERCQLCLYCEEEAAQRDDYSLNAIGSTDFATGWDEGITFPVAGAAVVMDADAALNLDALTIFLEAIDFDTDASAETILQNGTNYVLSIATAAGQCTVTLNASSIVFPAEGSRTLAVTALDGERPVFYLNGRYIGLGADTATVDSGGAGQLTIGNNTAKNNPFASTLKKLTVYSEALSADEIRAAHVMAMVTRNFTP